MTRYILNYIGGCKGDFLCNFINNKVNCLIEMNTLTKKSKPLNGSLKSLSYQPYNKKILIDTINEFPNTQIFPTHSAKIINATDLEELDLKIINLNITEEYFNTAKIELAFKQKFEFIDKKHILSAFAFNNGKSFNFSSTDIKNLIANVSYHIDFDMYKKGIELNDSNRVKYFTSCLSSIIQYPSKLSNIDIIDFESHYTIDYGTIFIEKDFKDLTQLFDIDSTQLSLQIDQTWLPKKISSWNHTFYPADYGYKY
jgi:hypothetical protein